MEMRLRGGPFRFGKPSVQARGELLCTQMVRIHAELPARGMRMLVLY